MNLGTILLILCALAALGYVLGRRRAVASAGGDARALHSLPRFYGLNVALAALLPALAVLAIWTFAQPVWTDLRVTGAIDEAAHGGDAGRLSLILSDVDRMAAGIAENAIDTAGLEGDALAAALEEGGVRIRRGTDASVLRAAAIRADADAGGAIWMTAAALAAAVAGAALAWRATHAGFRARNAVERAVMGVLILASTIAILTTLGIVLSMLFETINFFGQYPASEFFFGLEWSPNFRGGSELGIIPLLWGTLYISFIALLVAVPIGLLAAIYMSEYAGPRVRAVAKPMLEILAGIPTIVYGLFALITVGPLLRDYFAQPLGLGNSASSVMTAGLVMGIMLIPFVSS
ncbi:MAG: phosphate ABC transporter permease family protein, partial [Hasllibacter sp.]